MILDNSVIELGTAVDLDVIASAAEACRANVIVLPDVLENARATVDSILDAVDEWGSRFDSVLGEDMYRFMIVPQGRTVDEFDDCAAELWDEMQDREQSIMWGIPRNTVKLHGTRQHAIDAVTSIMRLDELTTFEPIHLLGFSDNVTNDIECSRMEHVGGIDSAVPIRAELWESIVNGISVAEPRGNWWENARYMPWMAGNFLHARETFK